MKIWRAVGASVQGTYHQQIGLPNQDAFGSSAVEGGVAVAVADGHGSARCFRSDRGSAFAVEAALSVSRLFAARTDPIVLLSCDQEYLRAGICTAIVDRWRELVDQDLISRGETGISPSSRYDELADQLLPYGSTLMTVIATQDYLLYLQLGDGDILTISQERTVERPLERDPRLFGNQTTSLCLPEAANDFYTAVASVHDRIPAAVLLATDGLVNSYQSETDFHTAALRLFTEDQHLSELLSWISSTGSGDDITVGMLLHNSE
ncbi:PP2C family serine/threonine-protein phosphatase [Methanosphaerula palustris]|uniref:PPM-type phosphatase domain-containing protein n=1 Tax=Methanosphaerula palustris (strain ATCC BAA-1556 / DSM 19958 / E1-9c) TaxID=521011 RepID=B8GKM8_METPE|nr:PP2C family serine/threonine-protein phosphatase [Methanosphaerula palustris]ACL17174.1 conserved hypothetical protein [Methanosphaerula palustris E1-9c]